MKFSYGRKTWKVGATCQNLVFNSYDIYKIHLSINSGIHPYGCFNPHWNIRYLKPYILPNILFQPISYHIEGLEHSLPNNGNISLTFIHDVKPLFHPDGRYIFVDHNGGPDTVTFEDAPNSLASNADIHPYGCLNSHWNVIFFSGWFYPIVSLSRIF